MATSYQVRLFNKAEEVDRTVTVSTDSYILATTEVAWMELPHFCQQSIRSTHTAKLFWLRRSILIE
jgi:hypothetical protein